MELTPEDKADCFDLMIEHHVRLWPPNATKYWFASGVGVGGEGSTPIEAINNMLEKEKEIAEKYKDVKPAEGPGQLGWKVKSEDALK